MTETKDDVAGLVTDRDQWRDLARLERERGDELAARLSLSEARTAQAVADAAMRERARVRRFAEHAASTCDAGDDFSVGYRLAMNAVIKALDGFVDIDARLAAIRARAATSGASHD